MVERTSPRSAQVGDLLPERIVPGGPLRRLDATALLLPGRGDTTKYLEGLTQEREEFSAWSGRVALLPPDGDPLHRLLVIDRYGQVFETVEAAEADRLPSASALVEWFRFLATACPECGVLDDPRPRGYVP